HRSILPRTLGFGDPGRSDATCGPSREPDLRWSGRTRGLALDARLRRRRAVSRRSEAADARDRSGPGWAGLRGLSLGVELQRRRVDAVAQARGVRSIVEDVAEVPAAIGTHRL